MQQQDKSGDDSLRELLTQPLRTIIKEANKLACEMTTKVNQDLLPAPTAPPLPRRSASPGAYRGDLGQD